MTDNPTTPLSDRELLEQIAMRLQRLEDARAKETKPLLGEIRRELAEFRTEFLEFKAYAKEQFQNINSKLEVLTGDVLDVRAGHRRLDKRVTDLERPKQ